MVEDSFFSWVRPTESNLRFIGSEVEGDQVLSIGCGYGLLEWLIHKATGLMILGLEIDRVWWAQPYRNPSFLHLHFCEETSLSTLCSHRPTTLLFCYFNNREAFDEYINEFEGRRVIIVGPGKGRGTHTDPKPFENSLSSEWTLKSSQEVGKTKDYIAVYVRNVTSADVSEKLCHRIDGGVNMTGLCRLHADTSGHNMKHVLPHGNP